MALDDRERRLLEEMKKAVFEAEKPSGKPGALESGLDPAKQKDAPGVDSNGRPFPLTEKEGS